jgi:hypothetical protein
MPRTFFLSPDPKPNHRFEATFVIEGTDDDKKPLAVVGDEYIIAAPPGCILFETHSLKIKNVDEKSNHRAELVFVSREGFTQSGQFNLVCSLAHDPSLREETLVSVATAFKLVAPPRVIINIPDNETPPAKTENPIPAATPVVVTPAVVAPVVAAPIAPPARSFRKQIITAFLVGLALSTMVGTIVIKFDSILKSLPPFSTHARVIQKTEPVVIPVVTETPQDAVQEPEAPDVVAIQPTHTQQDTAAPEPEVVIPTTPPPNPASRCGACP